MDLVPVESLVMIEKAANFPSKEIWKIHQHCFWRMLLSEVYFEG
jgi:hypothetical protein